jgi:hypothetical protein
MSSLASQKSVRDFCNSAYQLREWLSQRKHYFKRQSYAGISLAKNCGPSMLGANSPHNENLAILKTSLLTLPLEYP